MKHVAVSVLGRDRTGIVAAITQVLFETGCNIEDSSMTLLSGEFAMILIVAVPVSVSCSILGKRLAAAGKKFALSIGVRSLSPREAARKADGGVPHIISVYGADRPGIVSRVSRLLSDAGIGITDVQTKISGNKRKPLYIMLLEISLKGTSRRELLHKKLAVLSREMNVSISLHACDTAQL
jgi:glycine cleavage system transcriptional repressor